MKKKLITLCVVALLTLSAVTTVSNSIASEKGPTTQSSSHTGTM